MGRRARLITVATVLAALTMVLTLVLTGCMLRSPTSSSVTALSAGGVDEPPLSADDKSVLAEDGFPEVAHLDYSAFPQGGDPPSAGGHSYYVSPSGDDQGSDPSAGSMTRPFRTIERALAVAGDGDRVFVRSGTYASDGLELRQSRFLLASYQNEPVLVEAVQGARTGLSISHAGQHDVVVRGISFIGFSDEGVYFGHRETMRNLVLEDLEVQNSACGMAAAYEESAQPLVDGMLVRRVRLLNVTDIGFQFGVGPGKNVRITGLYVQFASQSEKNSWADGITFVGGDNVLVEASIVEGAGADGIDLKASRVAVVNSVVRHTGGNGVRLRHGGEVINTVVFDTGADAQLVCEAGDYRIVNSVFAFHNMQGGQRSFTATFGLDNDQAETKVLIANCVFYQLPGAVLGFSPNARPELLNNFFYGYPDVLCYWGSTEYFSRRTAGRQPGRQSDRGPGIRERCRRRFSSGTREPAAGGGHIRRRRTVLRSASSPASWHQYRGSVPGYQRCSLQLNRDDRVPSHL